MFSSLNKISKAEKSSGWVQATRMCSEHGWSLSLRHGNLPLSGILMTCVIVPYKPTSAQQIKHCYWHQSWNRQFLWPEGTHCIDLKSINVFREDTGTPSYCMTYTAVDKVDAHAKKIDLVLHQWVKYWFKLEWTSGDHLIHPCWTPLFKQGHLQQVAQDHVPEVF